MTNTPTHQEKDLREEFKKAWAIKATAENEEVALAQKDTLC